MDRISEALLKEFSEQFDLNSLSEDKQFERFAGYVTVRRQYNETFRPDDISTGGADDTGIDCIAAIVNGTLVSDLDAFREINDKTGELDVTFVFVQAQRSANFDAASIGTFGFGVGDFFNPQPTLRRNQKIADAASLMATIYGSSAKFKRGNPACWLYYVTTGKWTADQTLTARITAVVADLKGTQLFNRVEFVPVDAARSQELYRQTKNAISREFTFEKRIVLPDAEGVKQSFLGVIPAKEYLKLLSGDDDEMIGGLFYDNVRDWQEYNAVNNEIKQTIESPSRRRFALMNNGVTIITRALRPTGDRIVIEDYSIVNGCQTSYVLFEHRNTGDIDESVMVPIRLIETQDEAIINSIIRSTNRQTEVTDEQFFALQEFAKSLETLFQSYPAAQRLYDERRSRQYDRDNIEKTRIILPRDLIRAFAAVFLEEPHRSTRDYGVLKDKVGTGAIFGREHKTEAYYAAALAFYKLEHMFRNGRLDAKYKVARFQILMVARILADSSPLPRINANEMTRYCANIVAALENQADADDLFKRAAARIEELAGDKFTRDYINTEPFTAALIQAIDPARL